MNRNIILGSICGTLFIAALIFVIGTPIQGCMPRKAYENVAVLELGLQSYLTDKGRLPSSQENSYLVGILSGKSPDKTRYLEFREDQLNQNREIMDHWKTPLRIIFHSDQSFSIRTAGPDRIFGTEDDAQFD